MTSMPERLRKIRRDNGIDRQSDFAKVLELKRTTYSSYEHGKADPPLDVMRKICTLFGVDLVWLMTGEGNMLAGRDVNMLSNNAINIGASGPVGATPGAIGEPVSDPSIDMMRLLTKILSSGDQAIISMTLDQLLAISRMLDARSPAPRAPVSIAPAKNKGGVP